MKFKVQTFFFFRNINAIAESMGEILIAVTVSNINVFFPFLNIWFPIAICWKLCLCVFMLNVELSNKVDM